MGFPAAVERHPARFGVAGPVAQAVSELRTTLDALLLARTFSYVKSDGTSVTLTLKDVVGRARDFEMAYNPNDCVEIRWAAPETSPERASCKARAPQHQLAKMQQYRAWFASRKRPAR